MLGTCLGITRHTELEHLLISGNFPQNSQLMSSPAATETAESEMGELAAASQAQNSAKISDFLIKEGGNFQSFSILFLILEL